ncbi:hypothetical protein KUTeg_000766 [Tegillarca granosa]|uniref:Amino acid permease/ SLC12A domain-containing protein n=1 Tax=Tegillarca granosa TaxID=220873 RepID=A0ABQ9FYI6_TEGGR|nr:hypothetical protein KUTeg_000766 [Tegillarca granosa]
MSDSSDEHAGLMASAESKKKKTPDWSRFGLSEDQQKQEDAQKAAARRGSSGDGGEAGYQQEDYGKQNELYREDQSLSPQKPWWKSNFFISEPVLFGTWDGVFTSCLINILGVVIFLRMGWIVGNAGVGLTILTIFVAVTIVLIVALSAIGVCERCKMESGGVYFLLSHVLGGRIGGCIGVIYCFAQSVSCSLSVMGFGESIMTLAHQSDAWIARGVAVGLVLLLLGIYSLYVIVSIVGVLWLAGLYISSVSSCMGSLYGPPRILQSIANENVIPIIKILGQGRGPNKVPVYALILVTLVVLLFIFVGDVNTLAPIVTTAFMFTYAAINYSYFALAMSYDKRQEKELKYVPSKEQFIKPKTKEPNGVVGYGAVVSRPQDSFQKLAGDLDKLFPERLTQRGQHHLVRHGSTSSVTTPEADFDATKRPKSMDNMSEHSDTSTLLPEKKVEGIAEFNMYEWIKEGVQTCCRGGKAKQEEIVVAPTTPAVQTMAAQLTEDN